MEEVLPVLRLGHAQALQPPRMVDEPVGLQRGADPVTVLVLERNGLRLADGSRNGIPRLLRDLHPLEELLLGELLEERGFPTPEDVHLGLALPLGDASVRHRGARGDRAHLHGDVPLLLGVVGEGLERRVVDELRHRRDEVQLALDGRLGRDGVDGGHEGEQGEGNQGEARHPFPPLKDHASGSAQARARSIARRQPRWAASRAPAPLRGTKRRSSRQREPRSPGCQSPAPTPARYAAPSPVVSVTEGRSTSTPSISAWNWHRKSLADAPPSTRRLVIGARASAAMASSTSRLWYAMASSAARARWARPVPRVRPTSVPRA